jgi:hypothetical protein
VPRQVSALQPAHGAGADSGELLPGPRLGLRRRAARARAGGRTAHDGRLRLSGRRILRRAADPRQHGQGVTPAGGRRPDAARHSSDAVRIGVIIRPCGINAHAARDRSGRRPARLRPAQPRPAQPRPAQPRPAQPRPAQPRPAQPRPAGHASRAGPRAHQPDAFGGRPVVTDRHRRSGPQRVGAQSQDGRRLRTLSPVPG